MRITGALKTLLAALESDLPLPVKVFVAVSIPQLVLVAGWCGLALVENRRSEAEAQYRHAAEVRVATKALLSLSLDAESSIRGYMLSGNPAFLTPGDSAAQNIPLTLSRLSQLVADDSQRRRLAAVSSVLNKRRALLGRLRTHAESRPKMPPVADPQLLEEGGATMDQLRSALSHFEQGEERTAALTSIRLANLRKITAWVTGASLLAGIFAGILAVALLFSGITRRVRLLLSNVRSLTDGRPLQSLPLGRDEIGHLSVGLADAQTQLVSRRSAIADAESRFRAILDCATQVAIVTCDTAGIITVFNAGAEQMLGYAAHELVGKATPAMLHLESDCQARSREFSALLGRKVEGFDALVVVAQQRGYEERECIYVRKDGVRRQVRVTIRPLRDAAGQITGYQMVARDITEQRRSEVLFDAFMRNSPVYAAIGNEQGQVVYINPAYEQLWGVSPVDAQGRMPGDLWAGKPPPFLPSIAPGAIEKGDIHTELVTQDNGGELREFLSFNFPFEVVTGERLIGGVAIDVTEQRRLEKNLQQLNLALELQTRRAESAVRAKSEFVLHMSHELRTPMNSLFGMLDLLSETQLTVEQEGFLRTLRKSSDRLLSIVSDVLDLSEIEAGEIRLEPEDLEIVTAVQETVGQLRETAERKNLRLEWNVAPQAAVRIHADGARLRQVLWNFLANAIKFTESGLVRVDVTRADDSTGAPRLLFAVQDTGPGIPEDRRAAIFDPFVQGDSSRTRRHGGIGLGLPVSQGLLRLMQGTYGVDSAPAKGSTFWFTIPAQIVPSRQREDPPPQPVLVAKPQVAGMRILVVDDSDDNVELMKMLLEPQGCDITVACDGRDAVQQFKEKNFDLVFMDIQMPVMDGHAATREIRAWERLSGAPPKPIIALTAHADEAEIQLSRDAGCDAHLTKPVRRVTLLTALEKFGKTGKTAPTARGPQATVSPCLSKLIPGYLQKRRRDVTSMGEALQVSDFDRLRVLGHNIKGSGAAYGFPEITSFGVTIEDAAKHRDRPAIQQQIQALESYLADVKVAYR